MALPVLREDSLASDADGFVLRLSLPWIRSLPLASFSGLVVEVDGREVPSPSVRVGERVLSTDGLGDETGWWFLQDRVTILGRGPLSPGSHDIRVAFRLAIPYLQAGPDGPLVLPFEAERPLVLDAAPHTTTISRDVA